MIRDAKGLLRTDIDRTLTALSQTTPDLDAAVVRLAREYADAIDRAVWTSEAVDALIDRVHDGLDYDSAQAMISELHRLAIKIQAQNVLAQIGPKLMAALIELGATPRARKAAGAQPAAPTGKTKLDLIRDSHADVG